MPNQRKCRSILSFGDDFGDNCCTMRCQLPSKHENPQHMEIGNLYGKEYLVSWQKTGKVRAKIKEEQADAVSPP